jgi:asparagine synthase (glutamine-hydrolysing)
MALLLRLRYCPAPHTLFDSIYKVRPGHRVSFSLNDASSFSTSFIDPVAIDRNITFQEAVEKYEFYFDSAVNRQLMADVDVGILLSGGIDSALIAKFAAKHYGKKLKTFTVGFEGDTDANEFIEAKQTADLLGTEHYEVRISSDQYDQSISRLVEVIEEPLGTTSTVPLFYLYEEVQKHLKVVLTGQGADEPLGGYARYQTELYYNPMVRVVANVFKQMAGGVQIKNEKLRRALSALSERDTTSRFEATYALFTTKEIQSLVGVFGSKSKESIDYFYSLLKGAEKHPVEAMMSNDLRMNLSDDLLLLGDKISMHFSIEARVPLLDNNLVDFIESLPYKYRLSFGKGKIIHKKFAQGHLPMSIIERKKKGFKTPAEQWFKEKIGKSYKELLCSNTNTRFSGYFNVNEVSKIFDQHIHQGINREKQIFTLISIYHWMEKFVSDQ